MTLKSWLVTAGTTVLFVTTSLAAQARPDLSGSWDINNQKTAAARAAAAPAPAGGAAGGVRGGISSMSGGAGAAPMPFVIAQTAQAVTITRDLGDGTVQKWVYKLDGTESVNTNIRTTLTTRSTFSDGKLVTEGTQVTKTEQAEIRGAFKEVRWIEKDGAMRVETTRVINGGAPNTSVLVLDRMSK